MHVWNPRRSSAHRAPDPRRAVLFVVAVVGSLAVGYAVEKTSGWLAGTPRVAEAAALPGFGNVSGTVASTTPFKAAQVFIRNVDKHGSVDAPAFGVLYPDMDRITTLGAYYPNGPPGYLFKPAAPQERRSTQ